MKVTPTYSERADTAYVAFGEPREIVETVAPLDDVAIDLDSKGRIVGIEFVTASRYLDASVFDEEPGHEDLIGVTEIAEFIGKRKQNVAQYYTRRPDFPKPVAELPTGRYWRRGDIVSWYEHSKAGRRSRSQAFELALAAEWLTDCLAAGDKSLQDLRESAGRSEVPWPVVKRAAKVIDVETRREGRRQFWALPREHPRRKKHRPAHRSAKR